MKEYLLRQHLILSEKYKDPELAWSELSKSETMPETCDGLQQHMQPRESLSKACYWYLIAKQQEFYRQPALKLSLFYPIALLWVCGSISTVFAIKVLPAFAEYFDLSAIRLPAFTELVISGIPSIIGFLILFFLILFIPSLIINKLMKQNKPLPHWLGYLVIFNDWIKIHNQYVNSNRLLAWLVAGIKLSGEDVKGLICRNEWQLAESNNLEEETIRKLSPVIDPFTNIQMNQRINAILTAVVGVVIGSLIVAFYLPIFQLGSIV